MLGGAFAHLGHQHHHLDSHDPFLRPVSPLATTAAGPGLAGSFTSSSSTAAASASAAAPPRFCDPENLQAATDYLNRQLALSSGTLTSFTPSAGPLVFVHANPVQAADLINLVFSLLQQRERDVALRDDVDARMVRLENDYEAMARNLQRHKDKIALDERELRAQLAKYSKLETTHRETADKLKNTLDELKMVKAALVQAKSQFAHDKRKSERELTQIKLKFQKLATDRFKDLKLNYRIANPGGPTSASTSVRPAGPRRALHPEDDYHAALLRDVEAREHALLVELDALKRLLHDVWVELQHLLGVVVPDCQVVDLPFELVRETVAHRVREVMCTLRDEWAAAQQEARGVHELEHARRVVEVQQEEMEQASAQMEDFKRQVEELKRQMWETGQRMDQATGQWSAGNQQRHVDEPQGHVQDNIHIQSEQQQQQQQGPQPTPTAPSESAVSAMAARFAGRPLSLMSDAGDGARAGLRAQFEKVHAERARLAEEALLVGMERQRLEREKEILKSRRQSGTRVASQLGRVVQDFEEDAGVSRAQDQDGMDVDAQDLIHALDAAMEHDPRTVTQAAHQTPARPASTSVRSAYPPPETPQAHPPTTGGADASNIRAPAGPGASDLFGMGDVSRIPPTTSGAGSSASASHATPTTSTLATASNVWTTPLSAMGAGAVGNFTSTPQSPDMVPPSAAQGYLKPALRAGGEGGQFMTPQAAAAGSRQVKISPQSVAYYSSSTSGSTEAPPPASGMHWQSPMLSTQQQQQQQHARGVQVPTALGSSTSSLGASQQQQQRYVDENHTTGSQGYAAAARALGGRADNPFGLVRSGSAASTGSGGRYR